MSILNKMRNFFVQSWPYRDWKYIVIHHSATPDHSINNNWEAIRRYHKAWAVDGVIVPQERWQELYDKEPNNHYFKRPWRDIGYHYGFEMVNGRPTTQFGRDLKTMGAHAAASGNRHFNEEGIGMCIIGNFDITQPSEELLNECAKMVKQCMLIFNIPPEKVIGHRETYKLMGLKQRKSCPGNNFDMNKFRERFLKI